MGWVPGSTPGLVLVALASVSVMFQVSGEALASNRKEHGMPTTRKSAVWIRRLFSAIFYVAAGVGGNLIAGGLSIPA